MRSFATFFLVFFFLELLEFLRDREPVLFLPFSGKSETLFRSSRKCLFRKPPKPAYLRIQKRQKSQSMHPNCLVRATKNKRSYGLEVLLPIKSQILSDKRVLYTFYVSRAVETQEAERAPGHEIIPGL